MKVAKATHSDYASHQLGSLAEEPELGEELRLSNVEASASVQLVLDDDVRGLADMALSSFNGLGRTPRSVEEAERDWVSAAQLMRTAQTAITDRIRSLYKFGEES
ncbi:hypothetical protein E3O55_18920 [Cryobacterium sp. MDB1-18-2]|uniref:hypothetical protein n=1 Tax=unclassified Cryobacterium TaxID=2649013 RepID=UPI00106B2A6C|nr:MULTISPECIES: hypothetical protein [unclassified Cryobacterium]TFC22091.1 hypothetical protein E3O55_18920 [Cryobacterium sp. MDB1-18-2]TFC40664.1 hypothetical protein E3O50_12715 [Cryobacterium sp. MDB1-18-1]